MTDINNTTKADQSEVKKAAENVNPAQLQDNLQTNKPVNAPEHLTEDQKTPFIDEDVRTDN
ncbi:MULTISPECIES: hypothetical protein [Psychrobacter]|uniref:hypothetical protein n=1 Tax=Psychrobacter TaxID=497 RepID=UPI00146C27EF|nr:MULTISPECIES: hypothetical protein [Psychrobacter]